MTSSPSSDQGPIVSDWEAPLQNEVASVILFEDGILGVLEQTEGPSILTTIRADSGEEVGRFRLPAEATGATTTIRNGTLYGCGSDIAFAVEWSTGNILWQESIQGFPLGMTLGEDTIVLGGRTWTGESRHGMLVALSADDGSKQWRIDTDINVNTPPLVTPETVFATTGIQSEEGGTIHAFDRESREQVWTRTTKARFDASPVLIDGTLYGGTGGNYNSKAPPSEVFAVDPADGTEHWAREDDGEFAVNSTPVDVGNALVFAGDFGVERLSRADGSTDWRFDTGNRVEAGPRVLNETVYFSLGEGAIVAVGLDNGKERWRTEEAETLAAMRIDGSAMYWIEGSTLVGGTITGET
ncbi:PQQ-binding-like beta-propeller repeat protein [Halobacteriales archaeon Cl-PHB]